MWIYSGATVVQIGWKGWKQWTKWTGFPLCCLYTQWTLFPRWTYWTTLGLIKSQLHAHYFIFHNISKRAGEYRVYHCTPGFCGKELIRMVQNHLSSFQDPARCLDILGWFQCWHDPIACLSERLALQHACQVLHTSS